MDMTYESMTPEQRLVDRIADLQTIVQFRMHQLRALHHDLATAIVIIESLHKPCPEEGEGCEICKFTNASRRTHT